MCYIENEIMAAQKSSAGVLKSKKKDGGINLLPQEEFAASTLGRILNWLLSSFRIIVIATEMVVMIAFLSRFWLDARSTDLNETINEKESIIASYQTLEQEFRTSQSKLKIFADLSQASKQKLPILQTVSSYLPGGVNLSTISTSYTEIQIKGSAYNEEAIAQFLSNLDNSGEYLSVSLTEVDTKTESSEVSFSIKAEIRKGG